MAYQRKLGRTADQRKALLRGLTTNLIKYGKIETTEAKAKEVRRIAERLITLAAKECDNTVEVTKKVYNDKQQSEEKVFTNDAPSKLHARRMMLAYLYNMPEEKLADENKREYRERTNDVKFPVIEKLFEIGRKHKDRKGGYTRIYKLGPRRGDAAEMVILEIL
ncbi:MAG: 50S ribosomal protein L17 [Clostridia bacterium]|nr:50S ribosomal protein L17 [Clostridia bacterium]